jgi:small multidrug resistance pump
MSLATTYALLALAIAFEVAGTSLLKTTEGFTRPIPTLAVALCYGGAIWLLAVTVKVLPVGIVYALWSGMGIVLIASIGWAVFGQRLDGWAILGLGLILAGVLVINTLSKSVPHG